MPVDKFITRLGFYLLLLTPPALAVSAEESTCHLLQASNSDSGSETNSRHFEQQFSATEELRQAAAAVGAEWLKPDELIL